MKRPYLIQRLEKPIGSTNPFSFGGGLVQGGLSDKGMDILNKIFSFDYMGAAEFEWGAVPTALQTLAKLATNKQLATTTIIDRIFIICPKDIKKEVVEWILEESKGDYNRSLKEQTRLKRSLGGDKIQGWLKIEDDRRCKEPFMFFVNKEMYENTCKLFKIEP